MKIKKYSALVGLFSLLLVGCGNNRPAVKFETLEYGLYPQTHVNDAELIKKLNALSAEANGWYLYENNYYAKVAGAPKDEASAQFDDGESISKNMPYWFKCEPIEWIVLAKNGNQKSLVTRKIIDSKAYYASGNIEEVRNIGGQDVYANNYEHSDIRAWLNDDTKDGFYGTAFSVNTALGGGTVVDTTVDNSIAQTDYDKQPYDCPDTTDKVYLLSYREYLKPEYGFESSNALTDKRMAITTDYARAVGVAYNSTSWKFAGNYWTRSPSAYLPLGYVSVTFIYSGRYSGEKVNNKAVGVRPAITVNFA